MIFMYYWEAVHSTCVFVAIATLGAKGHYCIGQGQATYNWIVGLSFLLLTLLQIFRRAIRSYKCLTITYDLTSYAETME